MILFKLLLYLLKKKNKKQLKVFPDSTRAAVYAFLGVPYAEPPVHQLRFAVKISNSNK